MTDFEGLLRALAEAGVECVFGGRIGRQGRMG